MWVLPSYNRPDRCQAALSSLAACGATPGLVVADERCRADYRGLKLHGWDLDFAGSTLPQRLNHAFFVRPNEPWYGFISDDSLARSPGFEATLVKAAGPAGFATSADGYHAGTRMHGAVVFGGDLLCALGWWAPAGFQHCFLDDVWETLARALGNWKHCPQVMVEHLHAGNGKAPDDATYKQAYSSFDADRRAFLVWKRDRAADAVARVSPLVSADPEKRRLMRARSRSVMIATPVARAPCIQYTISLCDTIEKLSRLGIEHGRQWVIGSSNLPRARNELCARFLASGATDMLFIDDDMGWSPDAVVRLLANPAPVAALVGRKRVDKPISDPEVWCGRAVSNEDGSGLRQDAMGFIEFEKVGTAFMKISREAFLTLIDLHPDWKRAGHAGMSADVKANYYRFFSFGDDEIESGEDVRFCDAWREIGGKIWVDPTQSLSHIGEKDYAARLADVLEEKAA